MVGRYQLRAATYEVPMAKTRREAIKQGERIAADERQRLGIGLFPMGNLVELFEPHFRFASRHHYLT